MLLQAEKGDLDNFVGGDELVVSPDVRNAYTVGVDLGSPLFARDKHK